MTIADDHFFKTKSFVKFLLRSKTKFSVHSPFIYQLITLCLERPRGFKKLDSSLQIDRLTIYHSNQNKEDVGDFIIFVCDEKIDFETLSKDIEIHPNNLLIFFPEPHQNKKRNALWITLKNNSNLNVSIDLFKLGLLYKRPNQIETHLSIRLL